MPQDRVFQRYGIDNPGRHLKYQHIMLNVLIDAQAPREKLLPVQTSGETIDNRSPPMHPTLI